MFYYIIKIITLLYQIVMLYHLHHICINIRLYYNYCITCTSHFIYCLLSHNYIKHDTKNQSLYFTRVGWKVHRLTMMQWSNFTKCGTFVNILTPSPHTSSIGVAALEFPRYKALILILEKVLNCRYDLISAQWARMKPNRAKTVLILNFAADSSCALKCSFFYLLCSPYRLNNEMLTMHRQICLKTAETSSEKKLLYFFKLQTVAAKLNING